MHDLTVYCYRGLKHPELLMSEREELVVILSTLILTKHLTTIPIEVTLKLTICVGPYITLEGSGFSLILLNKDWNILTFITRVKKNKN